MAQNNDICGQVIYTQEKNLGMELVENYRLNFSNKFSYYEEMNVTGSESSETVETEENEEGGTNRTNVAVIGRENKTPKFYYNKVDEFYFQDNFFDELLFVKENDFTWKWELHDETKKIGNFNCKKATINFRGRNYTAWYTMEIPIRFGPWKFQGAPGLILEVYDDEDKFYIKAIKIDVDRKENCGEFEKKIKMPNNVLSIEEYIDKKDELVDVMFAQMSSQLPKGSKPLKRDKNCEDCNSKGIEIFNE